MDFTTLQKVSTLVCKRWFKLIRSNYKLSGCLNIKRGLKETDINSILENWMAIRILQIPKETNTKQLALGTCNKLEKVIFFGNFINEELNCLLPHWMKVGKVFQKIQCFDLMTLKNALNLHVDHSDMMRNAYLSFEFNVIMDEIYNLETLEISWDRCNESVVYYLQYFKYYSTVFRSLQINCWKLQTLKVYTKCECEENICKSEYFKNLIKQVKKHWCNISKIEIHKEIWSASFLPNDLINTEQKQMV